MTDAQAALAQVREALADRPSYIAACSPANIAAILAHVEAQEAENEQLREMLARLYAGSYLYCDDGELQDARAEPFIDFKRDSVANIRCAMIERGEQRPPIGTWNPLYTHPAPQPQPIDTGFTLDQLADACMWAEIPDSKYESLCIALAEERKAAPQPQSEPTEAQIEAGARALSTHWHDSQSMSIAREESAIVLRAALAAKEQPE